ncbi:MAG: adenine phosphoribosyltransferase [Sphaerochaeta sp.]|jgi:adenine phosphoribosyltransferase|nr:adenine phosphoribosyltransferase [Spirochaetales bacterium]
MDRHFDLDSVIRKVPDFPKQGILYYDITSILTNPPAFEYCIDRFAQEAKGGEFDAIACIEARGFIFGAPLALRLGLPLVLVRKMGKLPNKVHTKSFDLEYGSDVVCIQQLDIIPGQKILLVDDLIATGGTLKAAVSMFEEHGAKVEKILGVIGLPFLDYAKSLEGYDISVLQEYWGE